MLSDFPLAKKNILQFLLKYLEKKVLEYSGGFVGRIPKSVMHEGSRIRIEYEDGTADESELASVRVTAEIDTPKLLKNKDEIFLLLDEMAREQAAKQANLVLDKISEATERIGNTIPIQGEITPNDFLAMLEKVEIDFKSDGSPIVPVIIADTSILKSIPRVFKIIENDPTLLHRFQEIMTKQKQNWDDRTANRKLVD